jgi:hypothetical protein
VGGKEPSPAEEGAGEAAAPGIQSLILRRFLPVVQVASAPQVTAERWRSAEERWLSFGE